LTEFISSDGGPDHLDGTGSLEKNDAVEGEKSEKSEGRVSRLFGVVGVLCRRRAV